MKKNSIVLTAEQRRELEALISTGQAPARKITHARILLKADCGPQGPRWSGRQIHEALDIGETTVRRVRHSFAQPTGCATRLQQADYIVRSAFTSNLGHIAYLLAMLWKFRFGAETIDATKDGLEPFRLERYISLRNQWV